VFLDFKKNILGKGVSVVVCFFRIFLFYWLGKMGFWTRVAAAVFFLTFGFKYIYF
jgi:hypothetical protein